jgi:hypothetical protein
MNNIGCYYKGNLLPIKQRWSAADFPRLSALSCKRKEKTAALHCVALVMKMLALKAWNTHLKA